MLAYQGKTLVAIDVILHRANGGSIPSSRKKRFRKSGNSKKVMRNRRIMSVVEDGFKKIASLFKPSAFLLAVNKNAIERRNSKRLLTQSVKKG